jgi:DNA-binding PadR family transcriptional regulator
MLGLGEKGYYFITEDGKAFLKHANEEMRRAKH